MTKEKGVSTILVTDSFTCLTNFYRNSMRPNRIIVH
jgi:hypothetical protein